MNRMYSGSAIVYYLKNPDTNKSILDLRNSFNQLNKSVEDLLFETSQASSTKAKQQETKPFGFSSPSLFGNVNTQSTNACLFGTPFGKEFILNKKLKS